MPLAERPRYRPANKRVSREERQRWLKYYEANADRPMSEACAHFGAEYGTFVANIKKARKEREQAAASKPDTLRKAQALPPKPPEEWSDEAKAAMADTLEGDIKFLMTYYLPFETRFERACPGGELPAWQVDLTREVRTAMEAGLSLSEEPHWTLITTHPSSGKTVVALGLLTKQIVRNRNVRAAYLTKSQSLAEHRLTRIKWHLTKNKKLLEDFGSFKPDGDEAWTRSEINVSGQAVAGEPTLLALGAGQDFYGRRPDIIIADDVVDFQTKLTPKQIEEINRWWKGQVMSRLPDNGWGVNIGSRMGPGDLYSFCGEMINDETGKPEFRWVKFKAHDVQKCPVHNKTGTEHTAYPEGCLLNPHLRPLRLLNSGDHRSNVWHTTFQQEEVASDDVLVKPVWIFGGTDEMGYPFDGCLDHNRDVREFPNVEGTSVLTCDPSPSQFWSVQWWYVEHGEMPAWHLIDHWRGKGTPYQLLDFDDNTAQGMLVDWEIAARMAGHPIRHLIVEQNAAQRWLFQSFMAKRWIKEHGIDAIPHHTHLNKSDPGLGVWGLSKRYAAGKIRLPYASTPSKDKVKPIIDEATRYPYALTDDTVMSSFFLLHNEKKIRPKVHLADDLVSYIDHDPSRYQQVIY